MQSCECVAGNCVTIIVFVVDGNITLLLEIVNVILTFIQAFVYDMKILRILLIKARSSRISGSFT